MSTNIPLSTLHRPPLHACNKSALKSALLLTSATSRLLEPARHLLLQRPSPHRKLPCLAHISNSADFLCSHRELAGCNKVVGNLKASAWPIQGGLASITSTPIYHPPHRVNPARNAFADHLPIKTNMQIMQAAETPDKSKTPSPQKVTVQVENISPARPHKETSSSVTQMTV
jgi:hypothetical protein